MCGRYTISRPAELIDELEEGFDELEIALEPADPDLREQLLSGTTGRTRDLLRPRHNLAPTQAAPVVRSRAVDQALPGTIRPQLTAMRWGLQPAWRGRARTRGAPLINARIETATEKASFAEAMAHRRCLVPADGFFEWSPRDRGHQPHWLTLGTAADPQPICFAGLWDPAGSDGGRPAARSAQFALLTTRAHPSVAPLHDRMPIALPRALWHRWIDPGADSEDALALAHQRQVTDFANWSSRPVGRAVNRVSNDHPELLLEAAPEPHNLSLF